MSKRVKGSKKENKINFSSDLVRVYLQEIGQIPLFKEDEEIRCSKAVQDYFLMRSRGLKLKAHLGRVPTEDELATAENLTVIQYQKLLRKGEKARQNMMVSNLRLVVSIAKKYQNRGVELIDLIQEGAIGLERAVEKFDPRKGYKFSTYAFWWIRQAMTKAIVSNSRTIRLPAHVVESLHLIRKTQRILSQNNIEVSPETIATHISKNTRHSFTETQVRDLLAKDRKVVSLATKVGKGDDSELEALLVDSSITSPESFIQNEDLKKSLSMALSELTHQEREVIVLRYGLDGNSTSTYEVIGNKMNMSRESIRLIMAKAMRKLRRKQHYFQDFIDSR